MRSRPVDALLRPVYPEKDFSCHLQRLFRGVAPCQAVEHLIQGAVLRGGMRHHLHRPDTAAVYPFYCRLPDDGTHGCPDSLFIGPEVEEGSDYHIACGSVERIEENYVHATPVPINSRNIRTRGNARDILEGR